jgi:CRP/FNR family transcriptional regulator, cyclic AMP receptor protein
MDRLTSRRSSSFDASKNRSQGILAKTSFYSLPFFEGFSESKLQLISSNSVVFEYPQKCPIVLEKDRANSSVYFILQGWFKICIIDFDGQEIILNIVGRGEIFGEMAALDVCPRSADVITMTPAKIVSIPSTDFVQFLKTEPEAGIRLVQLMGNRLRRVNRFLRLRRSQAALRVADILLFLAEVQEQSNAKEAIIPKLSHDELGNLCGLARETVTRELTELRNKNLIQSFKDNLLIPDKTSLEQLFRIPPIQNKSK